MLLVCAGSVLSSSGSVPATNASVEAWVNMVNEFQRGALSTRLGIPMIYRIDAVHGHNDVYKATVFPHNVGLSVTRYAYIFSIPSHVVLFLYVFYNISIVCNRRKKGTTLYLLQRIHQGNFIPQGPSTCEEDRSGDGSRGQRHWNVFALCIVVREMMNTHL